MWNNRNGSVASEKTASSWASLIFKDYQIQCTEPNDECAKSVISRTRNFTQQFLFRFCVDFVFCQVFLGPALVAYWRGVWDYSLLILDEKYPVESCIIPNAIALGSGLAISFLLQILQHDIRIHLAGEEPNSVRFRVVSRTFSVIFGFVDIYYWKGLWDGIDCVFGANTTSALTTFVVSTAVLTCSRVLRSTISAPIGTALDTQGNCCRSFTLLKTEAQDSFSIRTFDVLLTLLMEAFIIMNWHGVWTLLDLYFEYLGVDMTTSAWISMFIGLVLGLVAFALQFPLLKAYYSPDEKYFSIMAQNFILAFISGFATINSFRGAWYLLDAYFLTDNYEYSLLNGQAYGALFLILTHTACSLHPGIVSDCPSKNDGALLPFFFLSHWWLKKLTSKKQRMMQQVFRSEDPENVDASI